MLSNKFLVKIFLIKLYFWEKNLFEQKNVLTKIVENEDFGQKIVGLNLEEGVAWLTRGGLRAFDFGLVRFIYIAYQNVAFYDALLKLYRQMCWC